MPTETTIKLNMKCPNCGQNESFNICADIWGRYTTQGFDVQARNLPEYGNTWDQYAGCQCAKCGRTGVVEEFLDA